MAQGAVKKKATKPDPKKYVLYCSETGQTLELLLRQKAGSSQTIQYTNIPL